jgi:hypothetical protein
MPTVEKLTKVSLKLFIKLKSHQRVKKKMRKWSEINIYFIQGSNN